MNTSHKLTRIFVALFALITLSLAAFAGDNPQNIGVSDQKAGSMLVFPYYTNVGQSDTRISITNVGAAYTFNAVVHIMLMDKSCQQLDYYACITPNGTLVDKASAFDPSNSGYIIAVTVDGLSGIPIAHDGIIGNAFVNDGDYVGNYGAEAFRNTDLANGGFTNTQKTADEYFVDWNVPCEFAIEIQSPKDAVQRVIIAGLVGNINTGTVTGAGQVGTGFAYNAQENGGSFQRFITGNCFADTTITNTNPRVPTTLGTLINTGNAGHLRFSIGGGVGLLLTGKSSKSGVSGIRTLHKTKTTVARLTFPVFMPTCQ